MDFKIPEPLKVEHEELHAELVALTKSPGKVGEAARNVATLVHPHFVKEEEYALPPLGLLATIARQGVTPEMRAVLTMTERLKKDLPEMLAEHQRVVGALEKLAAESRVEKCPDAERFAQKLREHAETEEHVLYPRPFSSGSTCAPGSGCESGPRTSASSSRLSRPLRTAGPPILTRRWG